MGSFLLTAYRELIAFAKCDSRQNARFDAGMPQSSTQFRHDVAPPFIRARWLGDNSPHEFVMRCRN
jgi:hypothetical protein